MEASDVKRGVIVQYSPRGRKRVWWWRRNKEGVLIETYGSTSYYGTAGHVYILWDREKYARREFLFDLEFVGPNKENYPPPTLTSYELGFRVTEEMDKDTTGGNNA